MTPEAEAGGWRTFLWLWGSQAISVIGSAVSGFAFNIYLTGTRFPLAEQKPQLAAALSLTALAWTLTALLSAPVAGTWTDRHNRKQIMLVCDLLAALLTFATLGLLLLPAAPLWALVVVTGLMGLVSTFHGSAFDASYATLVPRQQLPRANGMMQTVWSLSGLVGPALAAALIGVPALLRQHSELPAWMAGLSNGVPFAFLMDGLSFVLAFAILLRLRVPSRHGVATETGEKRRFTDDLKFGWQFIWARRPLLYLLLTFAACNFLTSCIGILEPLMARFTLEPDWRAHGGSLQSTLAALTIAGSAGGVAGGLMISAWGGLKKNRVLGVLCPMVLMGLAEAGLGASRQVAPAVAALVLFGLTVPLMNAHSQSIWQSQVPSELQGRVFSVRRMIAQFTAPVSTALTGVLAARYAPGSITLIAGAALTVIAALQLLNPQLRRVEDTDLGRPDLAPIPQNS